MLEMYLPDRWVLDVTGQGRVVENQYLEVSAQQCEGTVRRALHCGGSFLKPSFSSLHAPFFSHI